MQHNQLMLHAQDQILPLNELAENDQQESALIYDQFNRDSAAYLNTVSQQNVWNMVSAHQPIIMNNNNRQSQSTIRQPLPAHISSSRCVKQKQQMNQSSSQLSPAKKRIKESSPTKWSNNNGVRTNELINNQATALNFVNNPTKLVYNRAATSINNNSNNVYLDSNYLLNSPSCLVGNDDNENLRGALRNDMIRNENLLNVNSNQLASASLIKDKMRRNHQTITLDDTPSPNSVISVITISDSSDEDNNQNNQTSFKDMKFLHAKDNHSNTNSSTNLITSTCDSVLPLTPKESLLDQRTPTMNSNRLLANNYITKPIEDLRKNAINNSLRQASSDSDSDLISSSFSPLKTLPNFTTELNNMKIIKPEPMSNNQYHHSPVERVIESKKKRILSKSQSLSYENGLNQVASSINNNICNSATNLTTNNKQHQNFNFNIPQIQIDQVINSNKRAEESEDEARCLDYQANQNLQNNLNSIDTQIRNHLTNRIHNQLQNSISLDNLSTNSNFPHQSRFIKLEKEEPRFNSKYPANVSNLNSLNCLPKNSNATTRQHLTSSNLYNSQSDHLSYLVDSNNSINNTASFYNSQSNYLSTQNYTLPSANPSYTSSKYMNIQPPAHNSSNLNVNQSIVNQSVINAACLAAATTNLLSQHNLFAQHENNVPAHLQNSSNPSNHNALHQLQNMYGYNLGSVNKSSQNPYPPLLW